MTRAALIPPTSFITASGDTQVIDSNLAAVVFHRIAAHSSQADLGYEFLQFEFRPSRAHAGDVLTWHFDTTIDAAVARRRLERMFERYLGFVLHGGKWQPTWIEPDLKAAA